MEPLLSLVKSYEGGRESHARVVVRSLFEEYLSVEELFSDSIQVIDYQMRSVLLLYELFMRLERMLAFQKSDSII